MKEFVLQTDEGLAENVREYGCNMRSLQAIAEVESGKRLSVVQVGYLYHLAAGTQTMSYTCEVKKPKYVIGDAFRLLKWPSSGIQVGRIIEETTYFWWGEPYIPWDYTVLEWSTKEGAVDANRRHFTLGNRKGEELFDPFPGVNKAYLISKLLYQVYSDRVRYS